MHQRAELCAREKNGTLTVNLLPLFRCAESKFDWLRECEVDSSERKKTSDQINFKSARGQKR